MRALGPVLLFLIRPRACSGVVDGIVYCGLSATGFAMVENILYLGGHGYAAGAQNAGVAGGVAQVIGVFFARIVFSGFAHPLFTAMTGIGLGLAARSADRRVRGPAAVAGWVTPVDPHRSGDGMLPPSPSSHEPPVVLHGHFVLMVPRFFCLVGV